MSGKKEPVMDRDELIGKVKGCAEWLEEKARQDRCVKLVKIQSMRGAVYAYSILAQIMRDQDLESRVAELEEIMKDAVLIPNEQKRKKTRR